ncbi:small nucleolar RNP protein [Geopyxis carbonaria]|nr:small nucleolar RNP protein [Geopyxis carbonaria]
MSSRGGYRGGRAGGFSGGNRGSLGTRGRGGYQSSGPPDTVQELGSVLHSCEGEIVCQSTNSKIPYFNAPIYLENKSVIGKVDEILGPMNQVYFTVKPQDGILSTSFNQGDKFYVGGDKLLPLERFLPKPKATGPKVAKRGASRGSRGAPRARGGFTPRGGRGGIPRGGSRGRGGAVRGGGGFTPRGGRGFTPRGRGSFRPRG